MKKIYINKTDSAESIIGKVKNASDREVLLYIPKFSLFKEKKENFQLLKNQAKLANKLIAFESVDDEVLELANVMGIQAINPFFGKNKRYVSDIVLKGSLKIQNVEKVAPVVDGKERIITKEGEKSPEKEVMRPVERVRESIVGRTYNAAPEVKKKLNVKKLITSIFIFALLLGGGYYAAFVYLPEAKISLVFEESSQDFTGPIVADINLKQAEVGMDEADIINQIKMPGVFLKESKNLTKTYPATGKEHVERKATGEVLIYNSFSSSKQALSKGTRLSAPDGKIFLLNEAINVPGANVEDGKIVPSSIKVAVTSEKTGSSYNIGPVSRFRIVGFKDTPKYEGFYGQSKESMSGGFVGDVKVPTKDDISKAKEDIKKSLQGVLRTQVLSTLPKESKVLDGADEFVVTKEVVGSEVDKSGKFSVTDWADFKIFTFKEGDLISALASNLASESKDNLVLKEKSFEYSNPKPDFSDGTMNVDVVFKSTWVKAFDLEGFKAGAVGKNEIELKEMIFKLPGIKSAEVKLWPVWIKTVPGNLNKTSVDVEFKI
jgi:hypothetical protein